MLIISYKLLLLSLLVLSLLLLSMSIYIIIALLPHRLVVVLLFLLFTYLFFISINHCHMFTKKFLQLRYNFILHFYDIFHLNQLLILIYFRASFMEIFLIILIWF